MTITVLHCFQGLHGIEDDVYLSLPAALGENGVLDVIKQPLTEEERASLQKSAALMAEVQAGLKF